MRITNEHKLPEPLVAAVSRQRPPTRDSISVTTLIGPPQIRLLTLRHWEELVEDASDRLWATMGGLMHVLLEQHACIPGHQAERTLMTKVEGVLVTGTYDLFVEEGRVSDYKFVSVWTTRGGLKREWIAQLNLYAELLRRGGEQVEALQVVAIYRDWSKKQTYDRDYPQSQAEIFHVPLWPEGQAADYLAERVRLHLRAEAGDVAECSPEERWERPTKYALMKQGRKRAVKLFDDAAAAAMAVTGDDHFVVTRPGASVRCESYCSVAAFCPQYARIKESEAGDQDV